MPTTPTTPTTPNSSVTMFAVFNGNGEITQKMYKEVLDFTAHVKEQKNINSSNRLEAAQRTKF